MLPTRQGLRRHRRTVHDVVPDSKHCTVCDEEKALTHFTRISHNRWRSECHECKATRERERAAKKKARPESHVRRDRKKHIRKYFSLSVEEFDAAWDRFWNDQEGCCAVCGDPDPTVMDHCHETGRLRGLLCRGCNLAVGMLRERPEAALGLHRYIVDTCHAST